MSITVKTSTWFEAKVRSEKMMADGLTKTVKEDYVVDALSFTEAEARITEEVSKTVSGGLNVDALKIASFKEVCFDDDNTADKWYKVKIQTTTYDEKKDRELHRNFHYLIQGSSIQNAYKNAEEIMKGSIEDYAVASVTETKVLDVFIYN